MKSNLTYVGSGDIISHIEWSYTYFKENMLPVNMEKSPF